MTPTPAPTLVLLHGGGTDHRCWAPLLPHLPRRLRVLTPDMPGHGDRPAPRRSTAECVAETLAPELRDAVGGAPFALLGHSFGGMVAMVLAAGPLPPARLILADTFSKPADTPVNWLRIVAMGAGAAAVGHERATRVVLRDWDIGTEGADAQVRASMLHEHAMTLPRLMRAVRRFDGRPYLPRIACPTLCLMAGGNPATDGAGERMARRLPDARVEVMPRAGHMQMRDDPVGMAAAIARFLDGWPAAR
ncbi:alpha/beta hydrolase [Jannaschia sp. Os4]|uniref:alpha/beta fold hydrolase n=1 Tax=Jannaschia sp. Os4 TaxID=2807617 RepID=UPI0019397232|nr:alpha/beta hydrolase [Jannaschia sp. Os4]MBM2577760.1 alpha/beta hydrolase [Jannaschia sp. Os4]